MQPQPSGSTIAQEVLWSYTGVSEEQEEQDFYHALEDIVAAEIKRRLLLQDRIWVGREIQLAVGNYTVQARLTNIHPLLSNQVDSDTSVVARYRARSRNEGQNTSNFISEVIRYPNERAKAIANSLVGLDVIAKDIRKKLLLLLRPHYLSEWLHNHYANNHPQALAQTIREHYALFLLTGEVGSGKTALARSIGNSVASYLGTEIALFVVNAQVRGGGHVGELTQNVSNAFKEAERCQEREQIPVIIFLDEADALAQARGGQQTHHEDDAGVNTLIQRIDRLRGRPIATIFATNLLHTLDSAIIRRACAIYHFDRPTAEQRTEVFRRILSSTGINNQAIQDLVTRTEARQIPGFGAINHRYTYSDLTQRIIPHAVEDAIFTRTRLSVQHLLQACVSILPTPEGSQGLESNK